MLARLRLLHLASPNLPLGAFSYSQGIEWAVEAGWLRGAADVQGWLGDLLANNLARLDLPLLARLHGAAMAHDRGATETLIDRLLAGRETAELRAEESQRGRALAELLVAWDLPGAPAWRPIVARSQAAGFAFAAAGWEIGVTETLEGYAWAWLEHLTLAAVKLVPLGQTAGQLLLQRLLAEIPAQVRLALTLDDEDIGAASPALAIASSAHEAQYSRLFRS